MKRLALACLLSACTSAPPPAFDEQTRLACDEASQLAGGVSKGILSQAEIREQARVIHEHGAKVPTVAKQAEDLLRELTTGSGDKAEAAILLLMQACTEALKR